MLLLTSSTTKDTGYNLRRAKWMLSGGCALEGGSCLRGNRKASKTGN